MNLIDLLTGFIPISSALLSVIAAIATSVLTKQINKKAKDVHEITIKLNDKRLKIDGYSEKELMEIISNAVKEEKLQTKKLDKTETEDLSKND